MMRRTDSPPRPGRPLLLAAAISCVVGSWAAAAMHFSPGQPIRAAARPLPADVDQTGACPVDAKTGVRLASNRQEPKPAEPKPAEKKAEEEKKDPRWDIAESGGKGGDSLGCVSCHGGTETSHAIDVGATCVGCHGGSGKEDGDKDKAHVQPRYPAFWGKAKGGTVTGNPQRGYTQLNRESPEFIRFVNPGDLRVAHLACGPCHSDDDPTKDRVLCVRKSMMTNGAMLYGAALYNNGAFPLKDARFGESYSMLGEPQRIQNVPQPTLEERLKKGLLLFLDPLPRWEVTQTGNVLRVFERGGLKKGEVGIPGREVEPGRPDVKLSDRGHGTLLRTDPVFLGLQKTRLLDPTLNFPGTNDHPGDYRAGGCSACHNVYANDRDPAHSAQYAKFGNLGVSATADPMLAEAVEKKERGHPITHQMTNGIPSSQCISCHMHPGTNMLTTYLGFTWWDNETDGDFMYPKKPLRLSASEKDRVQQRNPEGAALKGLWSDTKFLEQVSELNPKLKNTQFGDFHSHGWIFRKVYKQDRKGNLLDGDDKVVPHGDPDKWKKAVHLQDIHLEKGMHCVDCHFSQDNHGNSKLYAEPRAAMEVQCEDCHGTVSKKASPLGDDTVTSGPAGGNKLKDYNRVKREGEDTERWYEKDGKLIQRSAVRKDVEWEVPQVLDTITPGHPRYSERARLAKTIRRDGKTWGTVPSDSKQLAHAGDNMTCFSCHSSWTTGCFGCHLSMTANQKKPNNHFEGGNTRNYTSYNFQTLRDDVYMLGRDGTVTGNRIAPIRSSCAVMVSSQNQEREWLYQQQQTISAEGFSGTAFSSYVPHTVRGKETKFCADCHVSKKNDNNAWMANLLLQGTNYVNFIGRYAYVATGHGFEAIQVSERDEPQAVIGSNLHRLAFPDLFRRHEERGRRPKRAHNHHGHTLSLQQRGEYLYAAEGPGGLVIYDIANIDNKGFSERIVTAPVSPLGQRFFVRSQYATAVASPATVALDPLRTRLPENQEGPIHPVYGFLYVADKYEGLIVVGAGTLLDGNPTNNFLSRAATWNPGDVLHGANNIQIAGTYAYVTCDRGLVVVDLADPTKPKLAAEIGSPTLRRPRSVAVQFRYAFVCDAEGLKVLDVTDLGKPRAVPGGVVRLPDARDVYLGRTYAFVAGGHQGIVIVDIENPEKPRLEQVFDAGGQINDTHMIRLGMTNNSLFAYVADGENGLRVVQLTSPEDTPGYFGFSPRPTPRLIATYQTDHEALAVSEGLDRDRAVDESGNQLTVFGRRGARPLNAEEQRRMFFKDGKLFTVDDAPPAPAQEARRPLSRYLAWSWADALLGIPLLGFAAARRRKKRREE